MPIYDDDGARLLIRISGETRQALLRDAIKHYRPAPDHAVVLLRRVLGLPLPDQPGVPVPAGGPEAPEDRQDQEVSAHTSSPREVADARA